MSIKANKGEWGEPYVAIRVLGERKLYIADADGNKNPHEWARLQGFPDSFVLPLADTHLYKQFGNSVTVNVIAAIAEKIKEVLDNVD